MKARKELLRKEIKQYEGLIEDAKQIMDEVSTPLERHGLRYQIKEYKEQIEWDEKEIKEIGIKESEVIRFYDTFLIKIAQTVKCIEDEIQAISKDESKYDLETAVNAAEAELEEIRTFVSEVRF